MVMGDIQQHLRIRRRQQKNWDSCSLFSEDIKIKRNDHPLVQIAKRIALDYRAAEDEANRTRLLAELSKLACSIEKEQAAHVKHLITVCVEAAKLDIRKGAGGALDALDTMSDEELTQHLIEVEGMSEEEAAQWVDAAKS